MRQPDASRSYFMVVLGALLLLGTAACTWQELRPGVDHTRHLYVVGDLQQVSAADVAKAAQAHLGSGFFEVEVEAIQKSVGAIPWIASVSVHRRWPDSVVVRVQEHRPIARWDGDSLIGENGKVFTPPELTLSENLIALSGPQGSSPTLLAEYPELQSILAKTGREISELRLDVRGSWQATLKDGLVVQLGRADPEIRLQRFVNQLLNHNGLALKRRLEDAGYVDLRYTDGFAVGGTRDHKLDQSGAKQGEQHDKKA